MVNMVISGQRGQITHREEGGTVSMSVWSQIRDLCQSRLTPVEITNKKSYKFTISRDKNDFEFLIGLFLTCYPVEISKNI